MTPSENEIHIRLWKIVEAYRMPGVIIFHVPNGEKRSPKIARLLRQMGVVPGVSDFFFCANQAAAFLELKAAEGRLSAAQKDFIAVAAGQAIPTYVAYSLINAVDILQKAGVLRPEIHFTHSDVHDGRGAQDGAAEQQCLAAPSIQSNTEGLAVPA